MFENPSKAETQLKLRPGTGDGSLRFLGAISDGDLGGGTLDGTGATEGFGDATGDGATDILDCMAGDIWAGDGFGSM